MVAATPGIDPSTGHIVSTGEISQNREKGSWQSGYNPQQAVDIIACAQRNLTQAQSDIAALIPELQGANPNSAAVAVRDLTYTAIYTFYALSSLGVDPRNFLNQAAITERLGNSFDYTAATDKELQRTLGPQYAQYVGKTLPPIAQQQQAIQSQSQADNPIHVIVDK